MSTRRERARDIREARKATEAARWEERKAAYQAHLRTPEGQAGVAYQTQKKSGLPRGVRIMGGVLAGVAVAHVINGVASAPNGWNLAAWANANGVQL